MHAHSIQRSGQLQAIAENNHVTRVDPRLGSYVRNKGKIGVEKISCKKVSTFYGFCKRHDNELFYPIDDFALVPTEKQVMLYSYRCLCREYFVKENGAMLVKNYLDNKVSLEPEFRSFALGMLSGFESLHFHKQEFDRSLSSKSYSDVMYVCFKSKDNWHTQFSGTLYPDYDFQGNKLQDLASLDRLKEMITFFTAPIDDGWAFVFAWHKSSNAVSSKLVSSLAKAMHRGEKVEDCLFRFSISCCENHAFRTSWWDNLKDETKSEILQTTEVMVDLETEVPATYLAIGLNGVASWSFDRVCSNMSGLTC